MKGKNTNYVDERYVIYDKSKTMAANKNIVFLLVMLSAVNTITDATSVQSFSVQGNVVTEKGSSITLTCSVANWKASTFVTLDRLGSVLATCYSSVCVPGPGASRYTFSTDGSSIFVNIASLTRGVDDGTWRCSAVGVYIDLTITVYTSPASIEYRDAQRENQDLSIAAVVLKCVTTSCTYPSPTFTWYYTEGTGQRQQYPTSGVSSIEIGVCSDPEKIHMSTLTLPRNTVFPGSPNVDRTVTFQCGMTFPTLKNPTFTGATPDISFAVQVSSVTLYDGASTPTSGQEIQVDSGVEKTLTCQTGTGRPAATIVWYIGTVKQTTTGTHFIFTPTNNDHGKSVYCKAYNTQPENQAVSSNTPKLYVRVQVSSVTLYNGASTPTSEQGIQVDNGVEKTLTCQTGTIRPAAIIVWYIGTVKQTTGTNFSFIPTNNDHNKTVYCKAYNIQAEKEAVSSYTPKLYVRVFAKIPTLSNTTTPSNMILLSGDEATFVCTTTATRPEATVTWKKGKTPLGTGNITKTPVAKELVLVTSVLTFTPVNSDNATVIICETKISGQTDTPSAEQTIEVWWGPSQATVQPSSSFPWLEGDTDKYVSCTSSTYGNPTSKVTWTSMYGTPDGTNRRLLLSALLSVYDNKTVTCELSNGYTQAKGLHVVSQTIYLMVQYKPIVSIKRNSEEVESVTIDEGQYFSASCTAVGNPSPTVQWIGRSTDDGQLQFTDIDRQDDNTYTCQASATSIRYPTYSFVTDITLDVIVNFPPDIDAELSSGILTENSSLTIKCKAVGRPDTYTFTALQQTWGGTVIPNTHSQLAGTDKYSSLALTSLQLQDTGNYTCHVNNGINDRSGVLDQTKSVYLKVKVSPKILAKQVVFAGAQGKSVNISVPFYSYPAAEKVIFSRQAVGSINNKYKLSNSSAPIRTTFYGTDVTLDGTIAILQLTSLEESDFGNYTLSVANSLGTTEQTIVLKAESKPSQPKTFHFLGFIDGLPQFYWVAGFNGGHHQYFVIETSITSTDIWKEQIRVNEGDELYQQQNQSYIANITGLSPKQYKARIIAGNSLGIAEVADSLTVTFIVPEPVSEPIQSSPPIAAIAGGVVTGLLVVIIVAVVLIFLKRRRPSKDNSSSDINLHGREQAGSSEHKYVNHALITRKLITDDDDEITESDDRDQDYDDSHVYGNMDNMIQVKPIVLGKLRELCRLATKDHASLISEFQTIPKKLQYDTKEAAKTTHKEKNRYREMYPYDQNRVKLPLEPGNHTSDYINASHIRGFEKENAYIAAQGAMKSTLEDVWRMIWTERIVTVVMLTNCIEDTKRKCEMYWPESGVKTYGKFQVTTVSEDIFSEFTIRTLSCKLSGSSTTREITHYHFTAWPDKDVPDTCFSLVQLWRKVKYSDKANVAPWMVHCSAGVGRTGTFIALDYLFDQGKAEGEINVHLCVSELRDQRLHMVQTSAQYVFLHQAVLEVLDPIGTVCKSEEYTDMWQNLQKRKPGSNETKVHAEYMEMTIDDHLVEFVSKATLDRFGDSKLPENLKKTRKREILPPDEYRPMLEAPEGKETDNYINAAVVSTYRKSDSLIITQVPLANTVVDFLRMVRDYHISTIVLMDDNVPRDCMYWPSSDKKRMSIGPLTAELKKEVTEQSYTLRTIRYTFTGTNGKHESRDVQQFHFTSWNSKVPTKKDLLLKLLTDVERTHTDKRSKSPLVVQCMDGASKSGLFCVLWAVLERMKCEREVGLSETIRFIKARRKQIIPSLEQYNYCYEFVQEYLDGCSEYANVM